MLDTTTGLIDSAAVTAAGILVPYILAILNQPFISRRRMVIITVAVSVAAGVLVAALTGAFDKGSIFQMVLAVLAISQLFYKTIGQHLGLPELEDATAMNRGGAPAAGDTATQDTAESAPTQDAPTPAAAQDASAPVVAPAAEVPAP